MPQQPTTRRIVLSVSPELLEQLDMVATEQNLDVTAFCQNAVYSALSRQNTPKARQRRSRETAFTLLSLLTDSTGKNQPGQPPATSERSPTHATHP
jgi:hypothetical protein